MLNATRNILLLLVAAILAVASADASLHADEKFDSAFDASGLPWYDSETKKLKSTKAPDRGESTVAERHRIPPLQKKIRGQQVTSKPPTAPVTTAPPTGFATIGTTIMYVVGIILVIALVAALIYGFLQLESNSAEQAETQRRKRKIRDHIKHLPFDIEEQDGDFESFAEQSFRNGDYSNAVIYLFADLLVAMSESGLVRLQRGKTNRQYLNEIWDHGEIRPYYQKVMTAFEDAFFGKHNIDRSRAEECFAGRAAFDAAIERISNARFAAQEQGPIIPPPNVSVEGAS